ncbi:capsular biosynthesis protein [Novosphingobium sp. Gsoil 351]|uniref:capsular biosynthesis protein n=1 Tax=Novosphingobium sp. Gsoil 351 TaxID=2675225 RepID=UPI001E2B7761|nr:capsular biosynthesis protein [Novosphingobium sp. Gsoil 351]
MVIDIDGTLCPIKGSADSYSDLPVEPRMRQRLVELKQEGWRIILSSARGMRTYDGNCGEILANVLPTLITWLKKHEVPFDELWMGKTWPGQQGFYVDDRTVRPREFVEHTLEELDAICARDRIA